MPRTHTHTHVSHSARFDLRNGRIFYDKKKIVFHQDIDEVAARACVQHNGLFTIYQEHKNANKPGESFIYYVHIIK